MRLTMIFCAMFIAHAIRPQIEGNWFLTGYCVAMIIWAAFMDVKEKK